MIIIETNENLHNLSHMILLKNDILLKSEKAQNNKQKK